jgi:septal ring factor EnvC (AmiA/AmiB activator)
LHQSVADLEKKQKVMMEQEANRLNPEDERAQLLANVRSDNAEVSAMEQQIKDLQSQVERVQNELKSIEDVRTPNSKELALF